MAENTPAPASSSPAATSPPPRRSMGKTLLRLFVGLFAVLVIALLLLFLNLNSLVRAGVVRGGQHATEQNTDLLSAALSLSQGTLQLNTLDIANPKDYQAPKLLTMKSCDVIVQSSSILSSEVYIPEIAIQGLELTLEQNGNRNNLAEIMEIVKKNTAAADKASSKTSPGKTLKIGKLSLAGTKVHVRANLGVPFSLDLDLPPLVITDPTNPDGRPMKIADLVGKILLHISRQIVENPQIPGDIRNNMKNVEALVNNLRGELDKNVKVMTQNLQQLQDAAKNLDPKALQDAGKNLQDAGKNIGNLFNQNKDQK